MADFLRCPMGTCEMCDAARRLEQEAKCPTRAAQKPIGRPRLPWTTFDTGVADSPTLLGFLMVLAFLFGVVIVTDPRGTLVFATIIAGLWLLVGLARLLGKFALRTRDGE